MSTLTNRTIRSTYGQLIQLEELNFQDGFGTSSLSGSYELIGDQNITGSLHMSGNFYLTGTASVDYLVASYESSSIIYSSGSTKFGDSLDDTHEFTGSITSTGSFYGMAVSGNFTGSGEGLYNIPSASNADRAMSASQADSATTASHALASSNLNITPEESSAATHYLLFAQSNTGEASVKTDSGLTYLPQTDTISVTKVIGQLEGSASYAETASLLLGSVENAINAQTASLAISTSVVNVVSTSFAASGDGPFTGSFSASLYSFFSGSLTGSVLGDLIGTASISDFATTASHALNVPDTASHALTAVTASYAVTSSYIATASFADIATLSRGGSGSFSGSYQGDGNNLTGINSYTVANNAQNRVVLATSESVSGSAASGLTYNGTTLTIAGNINTGQGATEVYLMNQNVQTGNSVQFNGLGVGTAPSGVVGAILATNDIVAFASSDERLKENLEPIGSAVEKVGQLNGYTFDWIPMEGIHVHSGRDVGVIAQEVEKVLPEIVEDRGNGYKAVKYDKLTALLIQAVNEQQKQIELLTTELNWVKNRL
tara:strand:- start:223 stop:1863 length:1641 start_codon:yes stop_codon:yes gene_type:complete